MAELAVAMVLAAFAGGAVGAALGALPAFTITGVLVVAGELLTITQRQLGGEVLTGVDVTAAIAFGPAFGPHVSFGGGAAAAAYATRRGYIDPDFEYHPAKFITAGLGTRPDVLAVGGVFGVVGYLVATGSKTVGIPWDPVALGVVLSAFAHRLAFGYALVGRPSGTWLDMSPFERGETHPADASGVATDGGTAETDRLVVEPWLPHQYRWAHVTMLGVVAGMVGAYIAYETGSAFLAFGVSAATLAYIVAGVERVPITHHITLPASTIVIAVVPGGGDGVTPAEIAGAVGLGEALVLGAVVGVAGALAGELLQRLLYAHAETHLDPPAASIVVTTLGLGLLAMAGVLPHSAWIPMP